MSFVIKKSIGMNATQNKGNVFDPEPYNYIFNNSTFFLDNPVIYGSHKTLSETL